MRVYGNIQTQYFYPRPPRGGRPLVSMPGVPRKSISIHALREEGDGMLVTRSMSSLIFLSTPSARRATSSHPIPVTSHQNFYPRPPRGGRRNNVPALIDDIEFLSTPSARRATGTDGRIGMYVEDFYPRPPRGGRRCDNE